MQKNNLRKRRRNQLLYILPIGILLILGQLHMCSYAQDEIASQTTEVSEEDTTKLLCWLEEQMEQGALTCEEDILTAISLGEEKFGITIPEEMKNTLVVLMEKIHNLGLEPGVLLDEASDLYAEYGEMITQKSDQGFWTMIWNAIKDFFAAVWAFIVDFVKGLLELIF